MSSWGNIGRPLVIIITVALASMTAVSSFLVYTAQQTTQSNIALAASQALRSNLAEDSEEVSSRVSVTLGNAERLLAASALAIAGKDPASDSVRQALLLIESALGPYADNIIWISGEGKLLYAASAGTSLTIGSDLSDRRFYELPLATNRPYISPLLSDMGSVPSFAIAVPVPQSAANSSFNGVLAAIVPVSSARNVFLAPYASTDKSLMLVSNDGTILIHSSDELMGKSIAENGALLSLVSDDTKEMVQQSLQLMAQGKSGVLEYKDRDGNETLMAYAPVMVNRTHVLTVAVSQAMSVVQKPFVDVFAERENFSLIATVLIAAISAIFITFILALNKRLFTTVSKQDEKISNQLAELTAANERLKEQDVIKDEFINIAAHELRTPVLPIVLSAENLADSMPDNDNIRIILRNANRITKLTNDILDVSRIESNTFKLQKQKTNIKRLIEEVIQDAQLKIPKGQDVEIVFEEKVPPAMEDLMIDRGRISQVLVNLVDNAVNFTESGVIRVVLEPDTAAGRVKVSITDSGKGIDPSVMPKLFGKFVSKSDRAKGTGLGLYLCKAIVESHGGTIYGENNAAGTGATFSFTLPVN
ncbi:sensor histidine kinase [Nitrososphaera viennensis]|uniref:histidine kinase n=2 Tax=Nitrososphaera viennensis TaxID=1034015 RepID=A0A060HFY7_9ARCH|nr:sensor histidine kinase [Nitrososphaera viennensis]AIC14285.1 putative membrane associated signal transduction histidine kinase, with phosphoacceptor and ATP binding domain [Nitrososphaera viennensis EN76]UVS69281.1 sensor histidine kinase [Nitrososphaera viennensis]